jgi:hypothetical protein
MANHTATMVPIDAITRARCAWRDCHESFTGDLPAGWNWVISHRLPTAELNLMTPAALDHLHLDIALCPLHVQTLRAHLVEMPEPETRAVITRA